MGDSVIAGRYRLERQIGAGGMSDVWAATDLDLDRSVAVKLLAPDADPARFEREARAAAGLAHANVCALYDYGEAGGRRFMVLELLPGGSLEDRLAGGRPLPDDETRRIAVEVAAGLAHAHQRGVVHRDLKPANILFDAEGRAKIADFGIARTGGASGLTEAGTVMGTAAYISPEQARGDPATPASDVYAFGVILFRMLTGRLPFESSDALALATMHRDREAPPVSALRQDAPPLLESLAGAALAKSPADRPEDGAALLSELRHAGPAAAEEATAVSQIQAPKTWHRRRLPLAFAIAAVAAAGVGLATAVTLSNGTTPVPPATSRISTAESAARSTQAPPESEPTTAPTSTEATTSTRATTNAGTTTAPLTTPPTTTHPATTAPTTTRVTTTPATTSPPPPTTTVSTTTAPTTTTATTTPATTTTAAATSSAATTTAAAPPG
ncbi:MAG: serine/threonine-protein kinase [Verrucomicrobiota bacterium]